MSDSVTVATLPVCAFCTQPANVDAKTARGPWAYMCTQHFQQHGIRLGTGYGQKLVVKAVVLGPAPERALEES